MLILPASGIQTARTSNTKLVGVRLPGGLQKKKNILAKVMETQEKTIVPQNKYIEAALKHQGSFEVYDPNFMLQTSTPVGTMTVPTRKRSGRKKKLTPEENRALNASIPSGNKYTEAARRLKGSFIVYDPNFML